MSPTFFKEIEAIIHTERILHWGDLDQRHQVILEIIRWMSPELQALTRSFDRFAQIRQDGLTPCLDKLHNNWPAS